MFYNDLVVIKHYGNLGSYKAGKDQAEDITQQVFLKANEHIDSFQNKSSLYTWLYSIATNTIINEAERRYRTKELLVNQESGFSRFIHTDFTREVDFHIDLGTSLNKLNRLDQEILTLRYYIADYSFRDIAKLLKINESAIKNRMYRCLGKMKNDLENWHIAAPFNPKQYIILVNKLENKQPGHDIQKVTDDFTTILRKNFERITSILNFMPLRKITYEIYPNRESLLANSRKQGDESHTVTATFGESDLIRIVSPLNPGPFDYHYIIHGSLFMYTASLSKQINPRIPGWLPFGVGGYVGSAWPRERVQKGLSFYYRQSEVPSLKDFGNLGNYKMVKRNYLCYTMVDFIVTRYSWDALHRVIRDPGNFRSIFQCTFSQWEEAWKQFVKEQYIYMDRIRG